jgi:5-dehydro-4-deoxyglucarate dehydratase
MTRPMQPDETRKAMEGGMLSFPLTDFGPDDTFDPISFGKRMDWLGGYGAAALFPAAGAGEYFSLKPAEYTSVIRETVGWAGGRLPVIAAAGAGTHAAIEHARESEALGADGILLLPPYMTESSQTGLVAHVVAVCRSVEIGVIVYNRGNCRLRPESVARIAEACPNFVALKDGIGDIEWLLEMRSLLGDRLMFVNGMPTAEIYASAYAAMGAPTYSSAIFNFVPRTAMEFHRAIRDGDTTTRDAIMKDFLLPYLKIRNRQPGYAVGIVKAGVDLVGRSAGPVRPPLSDLTKDERDMLAELIWNLGDQTPLEAETIQRKIA